MRLAEIIKRRREEKGISQRELAVRIQQQGFEVPRTTLANWEQGRRQNDIDFNPAFLLALANALEMEYTDLLIELGFPANLPDVSFSPDVIALSREVDAIDEVSRQALLEAFWAMIRAVKRDAV